MVPQVVLLLVLTPLQLLWLHLQAYLLAKIPPVPVITLALSQILALPVPQPQSRNLRRRVRRRSPRRSLIRSADPLPKYTKTLVKQQFLIRDLETLSFMIGQEKEKKHF
jgi:hypothetical protein